ncbi:uncharacterized protein F4812DRAFT_295180 [Daldinia caldariorum]|uniref:uncharacterized protein n=1 Tax=Daldinia caldariorum TaxID=326644 RepID=UPI002007659A|nr:uncharacterized protein F4812DRAFT_295180 [Daldinia caldariorum]KAI1462918.1 hypothetical protein F4812DRAFT_295180 [Daldinia caldariorum]
MTDSLVQSFVKRSRLERQGELDRLAREQRVDLGLILGLSLKIGGCQSHVDYAGGLDGRRKWTDLAKLTRLLRREVKLDGQELDAKKGKDMPSLRDALANAAPMEINQNAALERKGRIQKKYHEYAGILSHIDKAAIASFTLGIIQARNGLTSTNNSSPLRLPQIDGPLFGSAHVFYSIKFFDSRGKEITKWMIKIPINGTPDIWDELCAETLLTEALVLYTLRTETNVPVPAIIDADSSPHNEIHVPYVIMEYVAGLTLDQVWFGRGEDGLDEKRIRATRSKVLQNLAQAMLQLGKYEFKHGGAPVFDGSGILIGVGPSRELNIQAMVNHWLNNEHCERVPLYAPVGPFKDVREMYTAPLDRFPCDTEATMGVDKLLRLLVGLIREPSRPRSAKGKERWSKSSKRFVLTHPGLSMRHIIVSKEGDIKAIVGWDGVYAAPRSVGNEAFPPWLVRDFNTFIWRWRPSPVLWRGKEGYEEPGGNRYEDAPWVLKELRDEYVGIIQRLKKENKDDKHDEDDEDVDTSVTKQSLMALSLHTAAKDPRCRSAILKRILEKCSRPSEEFDYDRIVEILGSGGYLDGYMLKCLEKNFRELVDCGYVRGAVVW